MGEDCVISLEEYAKPVHEEKIETVINEMGDRSRTLYLITACGASCFLYTGFTWFLSALR